MSKVNWTIHAVDTGEPELPPVYALLSDDFADGLFIGEMDDVRAVAETINRFLATGQHDGEIDDLDPQLSRWLTVAEASQEYGVPTSSITWACRGGKIRRAEKGRRGWMFPQLAFQSWLARRPGSGRRTETT